MITIIIIIIIFHLTDAHEKKPHAHVQEAASRLITEKWFFRPELKLGNM